MEGFVARWYARNTGKDRTELHKLAQSVADQVAPGGSILEVAPGPGYLAIELARLGNYRVVGLDISRSFVRMATENASRAGVQVTFLHGNASAMPFEEGSFDFLICRAAFKNFAEPVEALREMHRVLKSGGKAVILDLRRDASAAAINGTVKGMRLGWLNAFITKWTFKHMLLKRAYSREQFEQMASQTPFRRCEIRAEPIGLEVALTK
jgi:ubiquinone/menaquinone biosynthesis C-methylase UbiE